MFVSKSGILYDFRRCLYKISVCLRVCVNFVRLDGVICGSPVGLRAARAALWDKKTQLVRARLQRARWRMHDSMSTRAIPRSSVAKAPVDKRVANILATPGKIQTAPPNRFKSLVRRGILPCVVFMD